MNTAPDMVFARAPGDGRDDVVRLGLLMFLGTVTMLFAAFTSAYVVRRSGADWRAVGLPSVLWVNTIALAASSAALEAARVWGRRRQRDRAGLAIALTLVLGLLFLAGQIAAWRQLAAAGIYLHTNPSSSFFFMMTGAHAVHVAAALVVLGWSGIVTWSAAFFDTPRWTLAMDVSRWFWHFLLGAWLYLFLLLSIG